MTSSQLKMVLIYISTITFLSSCTIDNTETLIESSDLILIENPLHLIKNCEKSVTIYIAYIKGQNGIIEDTLEYKLVIEDEIICEDRIIIEETKAFTFKDIFTMKCVLPTEIFQKSDTINAKIEFSSNSQSIQFKTIDIIQSEPGDTLSYIKYYPNAQKIKHDCCGRLIPVNNRILQPGQKYGVSTEINFENITTEKEHKFIYGDKEIKFTNIETKEIIKYRDTSRCIEEIPLGFDKSLLRKNYFQTSKEMPLEATEFALNLSRSKTFTAASPEIPFEYSNMKIEKIPIALLDSLWLTYNACFNGFVQGETIKKVVLNCTDEEILNIHPIIIRHSYGEIYHFTPRKK